MNIEQTIGTYYDEPELLDIFTAFDDDEAVGSIYINRDHKVIMNIEVDEDRQGEGIARALFEAADEALRGIYHAPAWACTDEGRGFALAMGGDIIDDETMVAITGADLSIFDID
ncbi:GNAT family N-acetyltransferase [Schaalia sp. ZJ405]|uniref:GNAT family N-acetyltransferase n=1 Tax=Schaalia sp. ZJ405 TaxID=2709403 RepID=UPI0013EC642D|nr:GNAT family N-acetyltransferase [Schaalia sp. ZJ405]QPK81100.1 GNAT family N-acetyltransferase [Schaalia sp. ZJ405]